VNPDPSRALADVDDTAAAGRDGRAVLPGFVDAADWRSAAVAGALDRGRWHCNNVVPDHSGNTKRTTRDIVWQSKNVAAEPVRHAPPCVFAGGTRQRWSLRGTLESAWFWWPDEGCHTGTPSLQRRGPFLLPAFTPHYTFSLTFAVGWHFRRLSKRILFAFNGGTTETRQVKTLPLF